MSPFPPRPSPGAYPSTVDLTGAVAVVTGASSGIGQATALRLADHGASLVVASRRLDRLREIQDRVTTPCLAIGTDVANRADVDELYAAASRTFGRVDILVASAGVFLPSPIEEARVADWDRMIDINLKGLLYAVAGALPIMKAQGRGHIVGIGSLSGHRVKSGTAIYSGTKFAVRAVLSGLRQELAADEGIRVSQVSPGVVDSEFARNVEDPTYREAAARRAFTPLSPADVADAVLYALSQPEHVNIGDIIVFPSGQAS